MDTDLFQGVLLGLLAVGLIVLIALLATLGGIRRALEQRSAHGATEPAKADSPEAQPEAESQPEQAESQPEQAESQPEQAESQPEQEAEAGYTGAGSYATPMAASGAAATPTDQADSIRSVLQDHGVGADEETSATPASQEAVVDSAFAAHADDPQEEPFQRDGRWWFRRGDELLLYDEASGQWQSAPEGGSLAASGTAPAEDAGTEEATAAISGTSLDAGAGEATSASGTSTETMPEVADQLATYWKCPTCGAVNGSTAATCRMCFAARP